MLFHAGQEISANRCQAFVQCRNKSIHVGSIPGQGGAELKNNVNIPVFQAIAAKTPETAHAATPGLHFIGDHQGTGGVGLAG